MSGIQGEWETQLEFPGMKTCCLWGLFSTSFLLYPMPNNNLVLINTSLSLHIFFQNVPPNIFFWKRIFFFPNLTSNHELVQMFVNKKKLPRLSNRSKIKKKSYFLKFCIYLLILFVKNCFHYYMWPYDVTVQTSALQDGVGARVHVPQKCCRNAACFIDVCVWTCIRFDLQNGDF